MTKFSVEKKIAAIKEVEAGEGIGQVASRHQMSRTLLERLVRKYRIHGESGIQSQTFHWSAAQKYEVLQFMHEKQLSFVETSVLLGLQASTIIHWEKRYLENGSSGLEDKKKARKPRTPKPIQPKTRLEELEEENQNLRMENEYLKKLNALVAEREKGKK
jgi:transposase